MDDDASDSVDPPCDKIFESLLSKSIKVLENSNLKSVSSDSPAEPKIDEKKPTKHKGLDYEMKIKFEPTYYWHFDEKHNSGQKLNILLDQGSN